MFLPISFPRPFKVEDRWELSDVTDQPPLEPPERQERRRQEAAARFGAAVENLDRQNADERKERQRLWDLVELADRRAERGESIVQEDWSSADYAFLCHVRRDLYYKTFHWKKTSRLQRLTVPRCERCGSLDELQAHHRNYDRPGAERVKLDLETLCLPCHRAHHGDWFPLDAITGGGATDFPF